MVGYLKRPLTSIVSGQLFGLTLANNGSDATNDIDIAAGSATDGTNTVSMILSAGITKRLDAGWSAGTGNGGLDTGTIADTTYHVYAISTGSGMDVLFSASASAPTMPAGYPYKRRIGSIIRSSSAIVAFSQLGDEFLRSVPTVDVDVSDLSTSAALYALSVPAGIKVGAIVVLSSATSVSGTRILVTSPDQADTEPSSTNFTMTVDSGNDAHASGVWRTNTSRQIRGRATRASTSLTVTTNGWLDTRGRLA